MEDAPAREHEQLSQPRALRARDSEFLTLPQAGELQQLFADKGIVLKQTA